MKLLRDACSIGEAQPVTWRSLKGAQVVNPDLSQAPSGPGDHGAHVVVQQQHRIHQLEAELEQRTAHAHQQGYSEGQSSGAQQASRQLEPVLARMARAVEELQGLRRRTRAEAEEDAVRLAIAVARKILHREFALDPDALLGLMKAAMQRIDSRELNRVRFHPADIPALERHLQALGMPAKLEIVADSSLERGSAIFETVRGNLDASISTQLHEIESGFIDLVRRSRDAV